MRKITIILTAVLVMIIIASIAFNSGKGSSGYREGITEMRVAQDSTSVLINK